MPYFKFKSFIEQYEAEPENALHFLNILSNEIERPHNPYTEQEQLNAKYTALARIAEDRPDLNKEITSIFRKGIDYNLCLANPFYHINEIRYPEDKRFINRDNAKDFFESMEKSLLSPKSEEFNEQNATKSSAAQIWEALCLSTILDYAPELAESAIDLVEKTSSPKEREPHSYLSCLAVSILKRRPELSVAVKRIIPERIYKETLKSIQDEKIKQAISQNKELLAAKTRLARAIVAPNVSPKKDVVNPKMSPKEKMERLNDVTNQILQGRNPRG